MQVKLIFFVITLSMLPAHNFRQQPAFVLTSLWQNAGYLDNKNMTSVRKLIPRLLFDTSSAAQVILANLCSVAS